MKTEEKRQRFHEALLQMLYPPPSPPPPPEEDSQKAEYALTEDSYSDQFPDESWERGSTSSSSGADEGEGDGPKTLTRAQRKRLRKRKLKEVASRRRNVIGPTLPGWKDDGVAEANDDTAEEGPTGVRQNADYATIGAKNPESEGTPSCSKRNKQKQRRMAKKLASERVKSSSTKDKGEAK